MRAIVLVFLNVLLPTILLFDKTGGETQRIIGPQPVEVVEGAVQEILP